MTGPRRQRKVLRPAVRPKSRGRCRSKTLRGKQCKNPSCVGYACVLHMRRIIREIKKDLQFGRQNYPRSCSVPSCTAVLKKNESGMCKGCEQVVDQMDNPSDAWVSRGGV